MDEQTVLKSVLSKTLSTAIRHGLSGLGVWLTAKQIGTLSEGTINNLTELIVGAVCVLITAGYSVYKAHTAQKTVVSLQKSMLQVGKSPTPRDGSGNPIVSVLFMAFMAGALTGCAVTSKFDQNSYDTAQSLKIEVLALFDKADGKASEYPLEIARLKDRMNFALSYENGKGKPNVISAKQWEIVVSDTHNLVGSFLKKWEEGKPLSKAYLIEKRDQISDGFDQIIKLEAAKPR